ncbi:PREDICTED: maestro heat-like repeat-containing protein family member 9 [Chrysochloris asiatica]|uniref:Maestro heat-like repeat-containing protein family member 9 n=1 Tax=Chrysochloris asiatica TaxID=185453 RepID=A0A9B0TYJ9_CHRAS|nr:PREDICTED: maestro heat-like repeat-containing protein family member 9 [Chrysochloris asiatica]
MTSRILYRGTQRFPYPESPIREVKMPRGSRSRTSRVAPPASRAPQMRVAPRPAPAAHPPAAAPPSANHMIASLLEAYSGLLSNQALILAMNSSSVDPLIQFEFQVVLVQSSFKLAIVLPSLEKIKEAKANSNHQEDLETLYQNVFNIFEDTLLILVSKDLYKLQILKEIIVWMGEDSSYMQKRIMVIISKVLSVASRKAKSYMSVDAPCLGELAAELCLLCSHSNPEITQQASLGMYHLLCIAQYQNADFFEKYTFYKKSGRHSITSCPSELEYLPKILQQDKAKIAQHVGQNLMPPLLTDFVWNLMMKLSKDNNKIRSEAACMLKLTLEHYADKVTMVSKIVDTIYNTLCDNSNNVMSHAMLRVITLLTRTSPKKIIFQLMDYPVPADNTLLLMWQAAGSEASVAPHVLKTLLLILKGKPGETQDSSMGRRRPSLEAANMMPVAASQALCMLLPVSSYKKAVAQLFPQLLMALMLQVYYSSDLRLTKNGRPFFARDALRTLLKCSGLQQVDIILQKNNCWSQFSQVLFHHHGVYLVAKALSDYNFPQFPETLHYLYKLSVEDPRRSEDSIITAIFLTELLNNFFRDPFPEEFLVLFRNWVNDTNPSVSKLSLQKIASMAPVVNEVENVDSLILSILDAFFSKDKTVVIRALITLRKLLGKLNKTIYSSLSTRIASSYCPLMDHSNGGIRSMAIRHFGELLKDMVQYTWMLNDVVLQGLVPLILFLEDSELRVVEACKYTLEICSSQLNWSTSYWLKDKNYNFEMVVLSICNNLYLSHWSYITDLISDTLGFLKSSQSYLRRGSVILLGYLANLCRHLLLKVEIEIMIEALDRVLGDEDPLIKELAQTTLNLFNEIACRLTSSGAKQTFQRLFNLFYFKKGKIIYHYKALNPTTNHYKAKNANQE